MIQEEIYIAKLLDRLACRGRSIVLRHQEELISGASLRDKIFQYARVLRECGIGPGKLLGLFAPNKPDAIAIRYAGHVLGAATVYVSMPPTEAQRRALVDRLAPDLMVLFPETLGCLGPDVNIPFATVWSDHVKSRARLDVLAGLASKDPLDVSARISDLAVVASSGGSTGVPKGSCRSFATYSRMVSAPSPDDRVQLINGPLAYLSQVLVDNTLIGGGCVVLRDAFETSDTLAAIEREKITDLFLVEPQLFELMDHPDLKAYDRTSLRLLTHIGASAPLPLRLRAQKQFGPIVAHLYGASEMGVVSVLAPSEHDLSRLDRLASAGRVKAGVEVRFRGANGALVENGEVGTIEVRLAAMASGYRNNPDLTAQSFVEGWYRSGDLGRLDGEGYLHILGRAVDAWEVDGVLVMPTDIEAALCSLPAVRYASVARDVEANTMIAAVVAWPGMAVDGRECLRAVTAGFGEGVAASMVVIPVDRVPLTEQGKPDRAAIAELARSRLAA